MTVTSIFQLDTLDLSNDPRRILHHHLVWRIIDQIHWIMEVLINLGLLKLVLVRGAMRSGAQSHYIVISHIWAINFISGSLFLLVYWLQEELRRLDKIQLSICLLDYLSTYWNLLLWHHLLRIQTSNLLLLLLLLILVVVWEFLCLGTHVTQITCG
jgi:hypothetical protein